MYVIRGLAGIISADVSKPHQHPHPAVLCLTNITA
jgi:hypothetical protein